MMKHLVSTLDDENHDGGDVDDDTESSQDQNTPAGNLSEGRHRSGQIHTSNKDPFHTNFHSKNFFAR